MKNISKMKGFTLIELLIVVAIIGILAAIAIPGYIGMQDRSRKATIIRTATAAEPELQSWLNCAKKSGTAQGVLKEVDTNGDGKADASDDNNDTMAQAGVVTKYIAARPNEMSPWGGVLWGTTAGGAPKQITLEQNGTGGSVSSIVMSVKDKGGIPIYTKTISAD